jgi:hypothetical protein
MRYNNAKKYKVISAKINKKLINDELELQPISSKGPSILQQILERLGKIDEDIASVKTTLERHDAMFREHG